MMAVVRHNQTNNMGEVGDSFEGVKRALSLESNK